MENKEKTINFWTWFLNILGPFIEELSEKNAKRDDVYIYKTILYPPKSTPPNTN